MIAPPTEKSLALLNARFAPQKVSVRELDYPLDDKSLGVQNFSEWSYFKKHKENVGNLKLHSSQWSPSLVQRIKKQESYKISKKNIFIEATEILHPKKIIEASKWNASDGGGSVTSYGSVSGTKVTPLSVKNKLSKKSSIQSIKEAP